MNKAADIEPTKTVTGYHRSSVEVISPIEVFKFSPILVDVDI